MQVTGTTVLLSAVANGDTFLDGNGTPYIKTDGTPATAGNFAVVRLSDGHAQDYGNTAVTHVPLQASPV